MSEQADEQQPPVDPAVEQVEEPEDEPEITEADALEPEDDEAEVADVPPETTGLASEADIEKAQKSLTKLREHVAKRMGDIFGDDAPMYVPCVICGETTPGFMLPPQIAPPDDETVSVLKAYIGLANMDDYNQAKDATRCPDCSGLGWVRTDSQVANFELKQCSRCVGKGYIGTGIYVAPETGEATNGMQEYTATPLPPAPETGLPPELQQYKDRGYLIVPPTQPVNSQP